MEGWIPQSSKVKRWDGAARSCSEWDNLRRDPELWFRNGNCLVHLYGKGQSRRGPAFKVRFETLLAARCHQFVKRFTSLDIPESDGPFCDHEEDLDRWTILNPNGIIELYIPAPPMADKTQAFAYHLSTRNFFAWIFRRSLVGEHLGTALIGLMDSMLEFRSDDRDNVPDLVSYLDEEGYLDVKGQPEYALGLLHLAENFQMRDIYIDAFSHCVGMRKELLSKPEYEHISSISRTLIRRARSEMNNRLSQAGGMLKTFLEDELSEANLGLQAGARTHLDRFRSFIQSFYTKKLGCYPPLTDDPESTVFDAETLATLCKDFSAVYELLVDEGFTSAESSPLLAQGGICALQSVHAFDERCNFESLKHPLPLLPELSDGKAPRRKSRGWLANAPKGGDKLKPDQRLIAHAAFIKAMNTRKPALLENDFVRAYRKFEEDSVAPHVKVEKVERISLVDARKVRWILIYAVYQVLRSCTQAPPEVRGDAFGADYHLAVSTAQLPPWKDKQGLRPLAQNQSQSQSQRQSQSKTTKGPWNMLHSSSSVIDWAQKSQQSPSVLSPKTVLSPTLDIRPDVDYSARSRREQLTARRRSLGSGVVPLVPPRSHSRGVPRGSPFQRTLSVFRKLEQDANPAPSRKLSYCEIVVHGYGNGTNAVKKWAVDPAEVSPRTAVAPRSLSTSSASSGDSAAYSAGGASFATVDSTAPPTSPEAQYKNWPNQEAPMLSPVPVRGRGHVQDVLSYASSRGDSSSDNTYAGGSGGGRRHSVIGVRNYAHDYEELIKEQEQVFHRHDLEPPPLQIRKAPAPAPTNFKSSIAGDVDVQPAWEQFKDLGGHMSFTPSQA